MVIAKDQKLLNAIADFKHSPDEKLLLQRLELILEETISEEYNEDRISKHESNEETSIDLINLLELKPLPEVEFKQVLKDIDIHLPFVKKEEKPCVVRHALKDMLAESKNFILHQVKSPTSDDKFSFKNKTVTRQINDIENYPMELKDFVENELIEGNNMHGRKYSKMELLDFNNENRTPLIEIKENKEINSPMFKGRKGKHNESDSEFISTLQLENLFHDYLQKDVKHNEALSTLMSCTSCLRYLNFKSVIKKLSLRRCISKYEFVKSITKLLQTIGFTFDVGNLELGRIYNIINPKNESLKELIGALSVLCSGDIKEKIKISFSFISNNNTNVTIDRLVVYLVSAYKVLLEQNGNTARITSIAPEELAVMTAQQCFDDNNKAYTQTLMIEEFVNWFSSHKRTLIPQVHRSNESKVSIDSYSVNNEGKEAQCNKESQQVIEHCPEPSIYTFRNLGSQPKEAQKQWEQFLTHYYSRYGFYPPLPPTFLGMTGNDNSRILKSAEISQCLFNNKRNNTLSQYKSDKTIFKTYIDNPIRDSRNFRKKIINNSFL